MGLGRSRRSTPLPGYPWRALVAAPFRPLAIEIQPLRASNIRGASDDAVTALSRPRHELFLFPAHDRQGFRAIGGIRNSSPDAWKTDEA